MSWRSGPLELLSMVYLVLPPVYVLTVGLVQAWCLGNIVNITVNVMTVGLQLARFSVEFLNLREYVINLREYMSWSSGCWRHCAWCSTCPRPYCMSWRSGFWHWWWGLLGRVITYFPPGHQQLPNRGLCDPTVDGGGGGDVWKAPEKDLLMSHSWGHEIKQILWCRFCLWRAQSMHL